MISVTEKKNCCGCGACAQICPQRCITMQQDADGFLYPCVDNRCVECGQCEAVCPMLHKRIPDRRPTAYGAINRDSEIRRKSSSGGVFYLLCDYVIRQNGVVFGAAFDKDFNVIHAGADTLDGCRKYMGSKYVPSVIGNTYEQAKQYLRDGRPVLFTGTPCQIAGLYAYLGKMRNHENLLTQDIVCHSVPAPVQWEAFLNTLRDGKTITGIEFRNKETGWRSGSFVATFDDGSVYKELYSQTDYMKGFLRGEYSRPSCYDCPFSRLERQSDLTLGDFWGVEGLYPKLYDNKGTSLVLVHSKKGKRTLKHLAKRLILKKVRLDYAVKYNPAVADRGSMFADVKASNEN